MSTFDAARWAALMEDLLRAVSRRPADLLPFEQVRDGLWLRHVVDRGVREVPLDAIVGSLGREREFTRAFLPRAEASRKRWERVKALAEGPIGFPPVELYQVGEAYFVVDGHHRVSVARAMGLAAIEARVEEFLSPVPLSAGASVEEVLLKRFQADFLEATGLVPVRPDDFRVSEPAGYERLLEHISVHRYFRGIELGREVDWLEAVASWRDNVYGRMLAVIEKSGVMAEFPGRTATDLYLFTMDHLHYLRQRYGERAVRPELAVRHFRWVAHWRGRGRKSLWARLKALRHRPQAGSAS